MANTQNPAPTGATTEWQQQPGSGHFPERAPAPTQPRHTAVRPAISAARSAVPAGILARGRGHAVARPTLFRRSWSRSSASCRPASRRSSTATQVSKKRDAGDYIGAAQASKQARMWTIVSLAVGVAVLAIFVIAAAASSGGSSSYYG